MTPPVATREIERLYNTDAVCIASLPALKSNRGTAGFQMALYGHLDAATLCA